MEPSRFLSIVFGLFLIVAVSLGLVFLFAPDSDFGGLVGFVTSPVTTTLHETMTTTSSEPVKRPNSCVDTDGGYVIGTRGTVSGVAVGRDYNRTDKCVNSSALKEYACVGAKFASQVIDCGLNLPCMNGACASMTPSTTTTTRATTTTVPCVSTGLGSPTIVPSIPSAGQGFIIRCPVASKGMDCIWAYANGMANQCEYSAWSGLNATFNCSGMSGGTYTATCAAVTGTANNCCAASVTSTYVINNPATTTTVTTRATTTTTTAVTTTTYSGGPTVNGVQIFPADHILNTRIDSLPVDSRSQAYINTIGSSSYLNFYFGFPYNVVDSTQAKQKFTSIDKLYYSDDVAFPIPPNPKIEYECVDRHMLIIDKDSHMLYEAYIAEQLSNGSWKCSQSSVWDLSSYSFRKNNVVPMWSTDAAGLPLFPLLLRYDEVASGSIHHAIRFTVTAMRKGDYVWPARAASPWEGTIDMNYAPAGQRFRLKSSFDISRYPPQARVILKALKEYGLINADNGGPFVMSAVPDSRWNTTDIYTIKNPGPLQLHASDFEAVDVSSLMINKDSQQARSTASPAPSIKLTSPNGAETWQRGTTHTVTWTYSGAGLGSYVKITLLKAGVEVGTIIDSAPIGSGGIGSYVWDISSDSTLSVGTDYKVGVQSITQPAIKDASDAYFTLTPYTATTTTTLATCVDSDGGFNTNVKGTVRFSTLGVNYTYTDVCTSNNTLREYTCSTHGSVDTWSPICPEQCSNGACVTTTTTTTTTTRTTITTRSGYLSDWSQDGRDMLPLLPANHIARTDISSLPLDSRSSTWINAVATNNNSIGRLKAYFILYIQYVGAGVPMQTFYFDRENVYRPSDHVPYALPKDYLPELASSDSKMMTINRDTRVAYEMSYVDNCMRNEPCTHPMGRYPNGTYVAGGGVVYALSNLSVHAPLGKSGVIVSGMQQLPLMLSRADIASGSLDHAVAISFLAPGNKNSGTDYMWPASATAYSSTYPTNFPKHGARVRLKANYDISGFSHNNQILLQGLKTYGGFFTITSGYDGISVIAEKGSLSSADNTQLMNAGNAILTEFEFVDETSLMISPTSYEARQLSGGSQSTTPAIITLTSPNGGETWQRGTTHTVSWAYSGSGLGSNVKIVLLKAGVEIGTIVESTSIGSGGTGSYVWNIYSASTNVGSDFKVQIQSISQPTVKDTSNNYFTLTPAA